MEFDSRASPRATPRALPELAYYIEARPSEHTIRGMPLAREDIVKFCRFLAQHRVEFNITTFRTQRELPWYHVV